mgnify:FL=1
MPKSKRQPLSTEAQTFKRFLISAISFVACMSSIVYLNLLVTPSEIQEAAALISLALAVPSGSFALYCYIKLMLTRFNHFFKR